MPLVSCSSVINRRALFLGSAALLAGCSVKPVVLDRTSLATIKRLGLPTAGFPSSPNVEVINGVGKKFGAFGLIGAVGLLSTLVVQGNRSEAVVAMMASQRFNPRSYFQDRLSARLTALNLQLTPKPVDGDRHKFLQAYEPGDGDDALLDIFVSRYGFFAMEDSDDSPYRPGVALSMRLVGRDRSVLMEDYVHNDGIDAPVGESVPPSFTTFSDAMAHPDLALSALRLAFDYAAETVQSRLS